MSIHIYIYVVAVAYSFHDCCKYVCYRTAGRRQQQQTAEDRYTAVYSNGILRASREHINTPATAHRGVRRRALSTMYSPYSIPQRQLCCDRFCLCRDVGGARGANCLRLVGVTKCNNTKKNSSRETTGIRSGHVWYIVRK